MGKAQFEYGDEYYRNCIMTIAGVKSDISTGTASSSAVTINDHFGMITTEDLTTAQNAIETITLTNSKIAATSIVLVMVANGTNTQGTPMLGLVTPEAGTCTIKVVNKHATSQALNGTLKLGFLVIGAA